MPSTERSVRLSVSLPGPLARRVKALAKKRHISANRVLLDLIEEGIEAREAEKVRFFELTDRLGHSSDSEERDQIKAELARMTFGE